MGNVRNRLVLVALCVAASLGGAAPARSQPKPSAQEQARQADDHFRKGKLLLKEGKKREAREEYLTAFQMKQSHDVAGNLGSLELSLGMPRDAAEHLSFAVRHYAPTGTTPEQLERARQKLDEAKKQIGTVTVRVEMKGAEVLVDGVSAGFAPLETELFVEPGKRTIAARLPGHEEARQVIEVGRGTEHRVTLEPTVIAAAPPAGASALPPSPLPLGSATVVKGEGGPPLAVVVVGGVLALGGLGAGAGLTVAANGKAGDAATLGAKLGGPTACHGAAGGAGDCKTLRERLGSQSTLSNAALGTFVAGGTFAAATVALGVWAAIGPKKTGAVTVVPIAGVGEAGAIVQGRF